MWLHIAITLVVWAILFIGPALLLRALARIPLLWTFNPANTFCIVVTEEDGDADGMSGGGNAVDILHGVPGKKLNTEAPSLMDWYFEDLYEDEEEDPRHDTFLYHLLGIQSMGSVFHKLRENIDKRTRFAREEEKEKLHNVTKKNETKHVFFSGELTVEIRESDTADRLGLDFDIDFIFERTHPARSVLRLADSAAFLNSMVERIVNGYTVTRPAEAYIGSEQASKNRDDLAKAIEGDEEFKEQVIRELGLDITSVSIRDVRMDEKHRALLELKVQAEKEGEALVITATKKKEAQLQANDADADRVERVIKPAAENERTVAVRQAEAYENNKTVTTYAPGSTPVVPLK